MECILRMLKAKGKVMTALRWLIAALLVWGLFTGLAYALVPLVTNGWGNTVTVLIGVMLVLICAAGLLRFDPRRKKPQNERG